MNTHIYSQQSQQSPAMAHDMHSQLPVINQHSYPHPHSHSHSHSYSNSSSSTSSYSQPQYYSYSQPYAQHHPQYQQQHQPQYQPQYQPQHPQHPQHHFSHPPAMSLPPPHGYSDQYSQHTQHSPPQHPQHSQYSQRTSPQSPLSQRQAPVPQPQTPQKHATNPAHSPTSPSRHRGPLKSTAEQEAATRRALMPIVGSEGTRSYRLDVVQQPKRARMCGFGDKDRRPITPPPCVRIIVTDIATGREVDCNAIEHAMFILNVDLWSEDALREVNLVRHTTSTPSISSTTPASYEQVESMPYMPGSRESGYNSGIRTVDRYGQSTYSQAPPYMQSNDYSTSGLYGGFHSSDYSPPYASQAHGYGPPRVYGGPGEVVSHRLVQGNQPQGMFTRNLIGSLAASAFRLQDPADKIGIWFVLQDLSVRTEGSFRLRFSFVNVGPTSSSPGGQSTGSQIVNTGKAPVLAACFSDVFTVYSAKKFPGVCESTILSKTFATQGIKIPIRKEGAGKNERGEDDDDFE